MNYYQVNAVINIWLNRSSELWNEPDGNTSSINIPTGGVARWISLLDDADDETGISGQIQRFLDVTATHHHEQMIGWIFRPQQVDRFPTLYHLQSQHMVSVSKSSIDCAIVFWCKRSWKILTNPSAAGKWLELTVDVLRGGVVLGELDVSPLVNRNGLLMKDTDEKRSRAVLYAAWKSSSMLPFKQAISGICQTKPQLVYRRLCHRVLLWAWNIF